MDSSWNWNPNVIEELIWSTPCHRISVRCIYIRSYHLYQDLPNRFFQSHFGEGRNFLSLLEFKPWIIHLYLSHCNDYTVNCHLPVLFVVYQVLSPHESIGQGMKLTARLHPVHAWENVWNWASTSAYALWHASVQPLIVLWIPPWELSETCRFVGEIMLGSWRSSVYIPPLDLLISKCNRVYSPISFWWTSIAAYLNIMHILVTSLCTFVGWDSVVGVVACRSLDGLAATAAM